MSSGRVVRGVSCEVCGGLYTGYPHDKNCTYCKPMLRDPVWVCLTCHPEGDDGICEFMMQHERRLLERWKEWAGE